MQEVPNSRHQHGHVTRVRPNKQTPWPPLKL